MDSLIAQLTQVTQDDLSISVILLNLCVGIILSLILQFHFEKFSSTLSGKKELARVLPYLVLIICLIISIVKSSLALSLGLVGALSIVRFRTPIKEPEELVYLFMAIAIGLGLGANQTSLTVVSSLFILTAVALIKWKFNTADAKNLYLSLSWTKSEGPAVNEKELTEIIAQMITKVDLKRYDIQENQVQLVYFLDLNSSNKVFELMEIFQEKYPHVNTSFIDQSRIPGI